MRQVSLGINQSCSNCSRVQIIPEFYKTMKNLMKKKNLFILDPGANSADSVQIQRLMTKYRLPRLSIHCANRARICKR